MGGSYAVRENFALTFGLLPWETGSVILEQKSGKSLARASEVKI
jgi:hypothetical protein